MGRTRAQGRGKLLEGTRISATSTTVSTLEQEFEWGLKVLGVPSATSRKPPDSNARVTGSFGLSFATAN
jgi:hypothetical protein